MPQPPQHLACQQIPSAPIVLIDTRTLGQPSLSANWGYHPSKHLPWLLPSTWPRLTIRWPMTGDSLIYYHTKESIYRIIGMNLHNSACLQIALLLSDPSLQAQFSKYRIAFCLCISLTLQKKYRELMGLAITFSSEPNCKFSYCPYLVIINCFLFVH